MAGDSASSSAEPAKKKARFADEEGKAMEEEMEVNIEGTSILSLVDSSFSGSAHLC